MKKIMIMVVFLILSSFVFGQAVPQDVDTTVVSKVQQEHTVTRQFMANEMKKADDNFLKEFTKRADFYESQYTSLLSSSVLKLGMMFAGIYLFVGALTSLIRTRTEDKKYQVLKKAIMTDVKAELMRDFVDIPKQYEKYKVMDKKQFAQVPEPPKSVNPFSKIVKPKPVEPEKPKKLSWAEKRKQKKYEAVKKEMEALEREMKKDGK